MPVRVSALRVTRGAAAAALMTAVAVFLRDSWLNTPPIMAAVETIAGSDPPRTVIELLILLAIALWLYSVIGTWLILRFRWVVEPLGTRTGKVLKRRRGRRVITDKPISTQGEDLLGYAKHASAVSDLLLSSANTDSLVVSLEGPWGSGKSSLAKLAGDTLRRVHASDAIVVYFDPWPEEARLGVVSRLLLEISRAIDRAEGIDAQAAIESTRAFRSLADSVARDFGKGLATVLRFSVRYLEGSGIRSLEEPLDSPHANRDLVGKALRLLDRRIVVVIDDIDRMSVDELKAILMAVHALSGLPNISFLLAFDPDIVDACLNGLGLGSGSSFREKIVDVRFPIPTAPFVARRAMLSDVLSKGEKGYSLQGRLVWAPGQRDEVEVLVVRMVPTPRSLKKVVNQWTIICDRVSGEVNAGDVLLLETLRLLYPRVWSRIREERNAIDPRDQMIEGELESDLDERVREIASRTRENQEDSLERRLLFLEDPNLGGDRQLRKLLSHLFRSETQSGSLYLSRSEATKYSRVSIGRNLRKYFSLGVEAGFFSDEELRAFIDNPSVSFELIRRASSARMLPSLMELVAQHVSDVPIPIDKAQILVACIVDSWRTAWTTQKENVTEEVGDAVLAIVASVAEESRSGLLFEIAGLGANAALGERIVRELFRRADLWRNGSYHPRSGKDLETFFVRQLLPTRDLLLLRDLWLDAVWSYGLRAVFREQPQPISVVFRLAQLERRGTDYERVRDEISELVRDRELLAIMVQQFSGQEGGRRNGVEGLEKIVKDWAQFRSAVERLEGLDDAKEAILEYQPPGERNY